MVVGIAVVAGESELEGLPGGGGVEAAFDRDGGAIDGASAFEMSFDDGEIGGAEADGIAIGILDLELEEERVVGADDEGVYAGVVAANRCGVGARPLSGKRVGATDDAAVTTGNGSAATAAAAISIPVAMVALRLRVRDRARSWGGPSDKIIG